MNYTDYIKSCNESIQANSANGDLNYEEIKEEVTCRTNWQITT